MPVDWVLLVSQTRWCPAPDAERHFIVPWIVCNGTILPVIIYLSAVSSPSSLSWGRFVLFHQKASSFLHVIYDNCVLGTHSSVRHVRTPRQGKLNYCYVQTILFPYLLSSYLNRSKGRYNTPHPYTALLAVNITPYCLKLPTVDVSQEPMDAHSRQ